jgi:Domain of unknown function (DUF4157)
MKDASALTRVSPFLLQRQCACGQHTAAGTECDECKKKEDTLQRRAIGGAGTKIPLVVHDVLRSPGQPLDRAARDFAEPRFRHDFSHVRIHTDPRAAESARAVGASAYTVGNHVVFGHGRYAPGTSYGTHLLAHELTHVVQQSRSGNTLQASGIVAENDPSEREAESTAQAVMANKPAAVGERLSGKNLQRHKDDIVAYSGGQSGVISVIQAGSLITAVSAVSGHPGRGENEPGAGPIPTGNYMMHPGITQPTVAKDQGGVCGAAGIGAGFQQITSTDATPCSLAHYCNVPCPTTANPAQVCYTPLDCWGPMRIKIEGSKTVVTPSGKKAVRDGFYLHGGNPKDAVSSGCVKSLNNSVFADIRKLTGVKGAVPFCVGSACPPTVAAVGSTLKAISDFLSGFGSSPKSDASSSSSAGAHSE